MVHIICDSTAGFEKEFVENHPNLHVVPLYISLGGEYLPEFEFTLQDVFDYVERTNEHPKTSQPSVGEIQDIINRIPEDEGIILLSITGSVSGTHQSMAMVAKQCKRKNVVAIDSMTTEVGLQFLVEDALKLSEQGKSLEEIVTSLHNSIKNMRTMFVPNTLEYLRRGGRLGRAASLIGALLQIKPVIYVNEKNEVDVLDKVRTSKKGYRRMVEEALKRPIRKIGIPNLLAEKDAEYMKGLLQEVLPNTDIRMTSGTSVLSCHLGPGLVALMVEWQDEEA